MEQLERAQRYLERIRNTYTGVPYVEESHEYHTDDVHSFFVHCYHVRDWIIQLNRVGTSAAEVDRYINEHEELRICADLCNGTKHCQLTRKMRTAKQPHVASKAFWSSGSNDVLDTTRGEFGVIAEGKVHDALELAERCMALW
jgi:hypothetical protein